ncbi:MAG: cell division protein FtsZ [Deltaproteobacteria bacterium]|jgi:cell division protein FtsZ|nr:cell division protein FtsZ [Deltaproteobacteria bacterium]
MTEVIESVANAASGVEKIMVIGIGGCGNNAINHMIDSGIVGPIYVAANSDLQDLNRCKAPIKIQVGTKLTNGLGCGGNPEIGRKAAAETIDEILAVLADAHIVFITAGLGGGTGTGGAPFIAEALAKLDADKRPLIVSVVVLPFKHEVNRLKLAEKALKELAEVSNSIIPVDNSKLIKVMPKATVKESRAVADNILVRAVGSISDLITFPGEFNLDFNDIKTVLAHKGQAIMGYGQASGEDRVKMAIKQAISSPLMADVSVKGAKSLLINVTADSNLLISEFTMVNEELVKAVGANNELDVFSGNYVDESLAESNTIKVTVIATGLTLFGEEPIPLEVEPEDNEVLLGEPQAAAPAPAPAPEPQVVTLQQPKSGQVIRLNPKPIAQRTVQAGAFSKYEENSLVDPTNTNPKFYERPTFMRNPAD